MNKNIYNYEVENIDKEPVNLSSFQGQVLLIVNVASECGFTPQYLDLQNLYEKYKDQGLSVLAFPCNDFGSQEPGTNESIKEFCHKNYQVTFDLMNKVSVLGAEKFPLYQYIYNCRLKHQGRGVVSQLFKLVKPVLYRIKGMPIPEKNEAQWNFHKFLVGKNGVPVASFLSEVSPDASIFIQKLEEELRK